MGRSLNTLKGTDITVTPIKIKYQNTIQSSYLESNDVTLTIASNKNFDYNDPSYSDNFLLYRSVRGLYYMNFISGSQYGSGSAYEWYPQSTAASGTFDNDYRYFPTSSDAQVLVISIPRAKFGENVARSTFIMSSSNYNIVDDGNGNLVDTMASNTHVGNILYNQGVAIITNRDYLYSLIPTPPALVPLRTGLILELESFTGSVYDGSNRVSQWTDMSGYNNHVYSDSSQYYPIYTSSYFKDQPGIFFSASSGMTETGSVLRTSGNLIGLSGNTGMTVFIVSRVSSSLAGGVILEYCKSGTGISWQNSTGSFQLAVNNTSLSVNNVAGYYNGNVGVSSVTDTTIYSQTQHNVLSMTVDSTLSDKEVVVYRNNSTGSLTWSNSNNSGSFESYKLAIGASENNGRWQNLRGYIGAVLMYNRVLNASERTQVFNYLSSSYL